MQFEVTPEYVAEAAQDCSFAAEDIETHLGEVRTYVVSLRDQWRAPRRSASTR